MEIPGQRKSNFSSFLLSFLALLAKQGITVKFINKITFLSVLLLGFNEKLINNVASSDSLQFFISLWKASPITLEQHSIFFFVCFHRRISQINETIPGSLSTDGDITLNKCFVFFQDIHGKPLKYNCLLEPKLQDRLQLNIVPILKSCIP